MAEAKEKVRAEKAAKFAAKQAKVNQQKSNKTQSQSASSKTTPQLPPFEDPTPPGQKKQLQSFDSPHFQAYSPSAVESSWYSWWEQSGFFKPEASGNKADSDDKFVIVLPPPNVTGALHCGHALANSLQDALIRWNRMRLATYLAFI